MLKHTWWKVSETIRTNLLVLTGVAVRVHWFRMRALLARWTAETETLQEEMFRTVTSYRRHGERWEERAREERAAGRLGAAAYAGRYV